MEVTLLPMTTGDRSRVMEIFNYYISHTFAAYPETPMPDGFFDTLLNLCKNYPTVTAAAEGNHTVGFGMLRPYSPFPVFSKAAEITYFVDPAFTRRGIGRMMLEYLITKGREKRIASILASISSLNEASIHFHQRNGFSECGRFKGIGIKKGKTFDVLYFQRIL